jgi:hypothetical protein
MKINARIYDGKMQISEYNRATLNNFVHDPENKGTIITIESRTPESTNMRRFFEGAVVPFITWHQEGYDHHNDQHNRDVREWLKLEFNGVAKIINGKSHVIADSTVGKLREFTERVLTWAGEQGYPIQLLNNDEYKKWTEEIYPYGGPEDYLDYLESIGKLKRCN